MSESGKKAANLGLVLDFDQSGLWFMVYEMPFLSRAEQIIHSIQPLCLQKDLQVLPAFVHVSYW